MLELVSDEALCDALLALLDFAICSASVEPELEAELADFDAFAANAAFAPELSVSDELLVLFAVAEFAVDEFEVELLAEAPLDASAVWFAPPAAAVLLAPLLDLLLNVELSVALAVPVGVAIADSLVPEALDALLVVLPLVAAAVSVSELVFEALALIAALDADALVAAFVFVSLLEDVALLAFAALLLALSVSAEFLAEVSLLVEALLVV